ncbi:MAG: M56 family metallopeptidase [Acidobacteriota bacterium]
MIALLELWDVAGRAVVSATWQVSLVGLLYLGLRLVVHRPEVRYLFSFALLLVALGWPLISALEVERLSPSSLWIAVGAETSPETPSRAAVGVSLQEASPSTRTTVRSTWPVRALGAAWQCGALLLLLRLGWSGVLERRRFLGCAQPLEAPLDARLRALARRSGVADVALFASTTVSSPCALGVLRPIVLFPLSSLTGLSTAQLEALALHELAHVRRHDYLAHVVQSVAETLLFFHPVARWLSNEVRRERELCCDTWAARRVEPLVLAEALSALERARSNGRLAHAANGSNLPDRIERLLSTEPHRPNNHPLGGPLQMFSHLRSSLRSDRPHIASGTAALLLAAALALPTVLPLEARARAAEEELVLLNAQLLVLEEGHSATLTDGWQLLGEVSPSLQMARFPESELTRRVEASSIDEALVAGSGRFVTAPKILTRVGEAGSIQTGLSQVDASLRLDFATRRVGDQLLLDVTTDVLAERHSSATKVLEDHLISEGEIVALVDPFVSEQAAFAEEATHEWLLLVSLRTLGPDLTEEERQTKKNQPFGLVYRPEYLGDAITLSLLDADLREVLAALSRLTGTQLALDPEIGESPVTVELQSVPWDQALEQILKLNCLAYTTERNDTVRVRRAELPCRFTGRKDVDRTQ